MGRQRIELLFKAQTPKKAANQDYTLTQYRLALILYFDHKDYAKALYYYKAAAGWRSEGIYSDELFSYDALTNTHRCPANQIMKPRRLHPQRLTWEYVTAKGTCLACKLRAFCTRSNTGRTIHRHRDQELLERARKIA